MERKIKMQKYKKTLAALFFLSLLSTYAYSGTDNAEVVDRVVAVVN